MLRSTSLVFGLLTVILTFAAVWRLSRDARFALLAGSLVAFNPQFLFSSGYFSNDPAAAAIGAAGLWIVVRAFEEPLGPARRHYVAGAIAIALGALIKTSTLPGLAAAAVTLIAIDRRARREVWIDTGIAAALVLLLAGPYLIWAAEHRGGFLGVNAAVASAVGMVRAEQVRRTAALSRGLLLGLHVRVVLGALRLVQRDGAAGRPMLAFFAVTWTGVLGWIAGRRARLPADALRSPALRNYLFAAFGATLAAHFAMNLAIVNLPGAALVRERVADRVPARARHRAADRQPAAPAPAHRRRGDRAARARRLLPALGADPGVS